MSLLLKKINKKVAPSNYVFAPEWIVLGVNNVCNLHCKMCDVGNQNLESNFAQNLVGTKPLNMPKELIFKIIDETAEHYPTAKISYAFTEPLVYPHLGESLAYAESKGLYTSMTTNALNLKRKAPQLLEGRLNEIYVSLDGPQDIHNEIRGHQKSFQKALEGIETLKESEHCPSIKIICALTEWNVGKLTELIDSLAPYGIDEIGFMHTQFISQSSADLHNKSKWGDHYPCHDSNVDEIDFTKMNLNELDREIKEIRAANYPFRVYFSPEINEMEDLKDHYLKPEKIMGSHCGAVYSSVMIKSDGTAIPAHGRCYNLPIGNIYQDNLKSIWKSNVLKKLRSDLNEAGGLFAGCSRCCSGT
ncbi:MAG: radical SAM protein [Crocinitomicaceae bacterium]